MASTQIARIVSFSTHGVFVVLEGPKVKTAFIFYSEFVKINSKSELEGCNMTEESDMEKWGLKAGSLVVAIFNVEGEVFAARQAVFAGEYYTN